MEVLEIVIDKETKLEHKLIANKVGENYQQCPKCSQDRRKKNIKCLAYNTTTNTGRCNHCNSVFYKKTESAKSFKRPPEWVNKTKLSDKLVSWFLQRNISQDTLNSMRIGEGPEWMPQVSADRNTMQFPYFRDGKLINVKYRDAEKNFKLFKDGEKIMWNLDGIKDQTEIYIVEGEIDGLTMVQGGFKNTTSVPNGGSLKGNNNLDYLDNCWSYFENAKSVYLLTDHDQAGNILADELARRIGVEKCYRVHLGEFKDVNEQLCKSGKLDVSDKRPYPLAGIFTAADSREALDRILKYGFPKGWVPRGTLGKHISIHPGYKTVITGIPGHGKSEEVDDIVLGITLDYDLRGGYFTPENWPTEMHLMKLIEKLIGKSIFQATAMEVDRAMNFLNERMFWIYPEEGYGLEQILEKVRQAVLKYGIQWYVIDPWNKLEHSDDSTTYIGKCLDMIETFNHKNGTHAFIVAHPVKMQMKDGKYEVPNLYSISGSANWYAKADIGLTMYKEEEGRNTLVVSKVKFKYWGAGNGAIPLLWDRESGRYSEGSLDKTNWLSIKANEQQVQVPMNYYEKEVDEELPF